MTTKLPSPESMPDFIRMFSTETDCEEYLYDLRWPDGFVCPQCGSGEEPYVIEKTRKLECRECGQHTYLTAGTILHKTHTPLTKWFLAAYYMTTQIPGISTTTLERQLGVSRETAFNMLHKIRSAMVDPNRTLLHGEIEIDETFIGGDAAREHGGRSPEGKTIVVGAVERRRFEDTDRVHKGRKFYAGRLRMRVISDTTGATLTEFVQDTVERDSVIVTDAWGGYNKLASKGYQHEPIVEGSPKRGSAILPLIHLEFSNLKTWLQGTHHGRVEEQHIQAYLNEFCFRHNRRFWPFTAFQTVLRLGMKAPPMSYEKLYSAEELGREVHFAEYTEG
jgi:transposase-like protein